MRAQGGRPRAGALSPERAGQMLRVCIFQRQRPEEAKEASGRRRGGAWKGEVAVGGGWGKNEGSAAWTGQDSKGLRPCPHPAEALTCGRQGKLQT